MVLCGRPSHVLITSFECTVPLRQLLVTQLDRPLSKNKDKYNTYIAYVKVVKIPLFCVFQVQFRIYPQWIFF